MQQWLAVPNELLPCTRQPWSHVMGKLRIRCSCLQALLHSLFDGCCTVLEQLGQLDVLAQPLLGGT